MTAPDTDTLAGLLADAPKGPWIYYADLPSTEPDWHIVTTANKMRVLANVHIEAGNAADEAIARLIALAPELAAEVIALRAQAAKDKARIERLEAALKGARALLRSGADLLSVESEALREGITVNGELRPDPEDAPTVEAIEDIEAWIADVADFVNALAALEDGE